MKRLLIGLFAVALLLPIVTVSALASQNLYFKELDVSFALGDDFLIYKNNGYILESASEGIKSELDNDDLLLMAMSETKNMSLQLWKTGESSYVDITDYNDNKVHDAMESIGATDLINELFERSGLTTSIEVHNSQKYYVARGFYSGAPDIYGVQAITINNGYISYIQMYHYNYNYNSRNYSNEILDSFEFDDNASSLSQSAQIKEAGKRGAIKGIMEGILYALILGTFSFAVWLIKKIIRKGKKTQGADGETTDSTDIDIEIS